MTISLKIMFCLLATFALVPQSLAYDNAEVHPKINEVAAKQSELSAILKRQLGRVEGLNEIIYANKTIGKWIREGGIQEDKPDTRTANHFHDPLRPWSEAGFKGSWLGKSSLIWAQDQKSEETSGREDWSWPRARRLYHSALTHRDKRIRETNLAMTFRSVGQTMHLLSDSSVPAHVRNDAHILGALFRPKYVGWTPLGGRC